MIKLKDTQLSKLVNDKIQTQWSTLQSKCQQSFDYLPPCTVKVGNNLSERSYAEYRHGSSEIVFNWLYQMFEDEGQILVHELAHHICFEFDDELVDGMRHTIDFAVLNALLAFKVGAKTKNLARAYDFSEDPLYPYLAVNFYEFDRLIAATSFDTVQELVALTRRIAQFIRAGCMRRKARIEREQEKLDAL